MIRFLRLAVVAVLALGLLAASPQKASAETWFFNFHVTITSIVDEAGELLAAGYQYLADSGQFSPDSFDITLKVDFDAPGFQDQDGVFVDYGYQVEIHNLSQLEHLLSAVGYSEGIPCMFRYGDHVESVNITSIRMGKDDDHYIQFRDASGKLQEIAEDVAFGILEMVAYDTAGGTSTKIVGTPVLTSKYATPEPATMLLFGSGLAGLAWYRRRKTRPE